MPIVAESMMMIISAQNTKNTLYSAISGQQSCTKMLFCYCLTISIRCVSTIIIDLIPHLLLLYIEHRGALRWCFKEKGLKKLWSWMLSLHLVSQLEFILYDSRALWRLKMECGIAKKRLKTTNSISYGFA